MKFNHLIQINDPLDPLIGNLTREQLWRGLVIRAEAPQLFMPHLDECRLSGRTAVSVERMLRYGELRIHDIVTYALQQHVHYQVPAQGDIPASSMCMRIEEPEENMLFVRFEYDDGASDDIDGKQAVYDQLRRSAYEKADTDTIRIIRELSIEGA
ncbi:MAG: SRPBCC family protein [Herbaspirillum sp.]